MNESYPESSVATVAEPEQKRKKKAVSQGKLGSAKAVETMFRNAIRAELELIALAATKANIMISLNGFIISALMISGAFLFNSSPSFLIPAGVFMLTSAGSIAFALFAASPERSSLSTALKAWRAARAEGSAAWKDLPRYVLRGGTRHTRDERNLLIYEDRVQFTQDEYWDEMQDLLRDRDEIYHQMSDQMYWLGEMANRKFKMLNISYSVFRWGLFAAIVTFLLMETALWAFPSLSGQQRANGAANMGINEFTDVYEPSAVQQLPDGRVLVVEDEVDRAMNLLTIADDGTLVEDSAADLRLTRSFGRRLNDLEGLSIDDDGRVYAITSHSSNTDGERNSDREQLLRFEVRGSQAGNIEAYTDLRDALAGDPDLVQSIAEQSQEMVDFAEVNIEGMTYYRQTQELWLGLRDPMAADHSIIVPIQNPEEMFSGSAQPRFGDPILLNLQGGGIRALSYDPVLQAVLIVNEVEDEAGTKQSQMWRWTGDSGDAPEQLALPSLINLNNVESIDSVTIHGEDRLLIMSDDGDQKTNTPAKYLVLDYDQLPEQGTPSPSVPAGGEEEQTEEP